MIKKITHNWALKLGSVVIATLLWILVTNINDPVQPIRFSNIPVTLRNINKITDAGKVYDILDGTDTISTVTVTAPRSVIDSLTRDNIVAYADFEDYTTVDGQYRIQIQLQTNKDFRKIESITGSIDAVRLTVEERASRTLRLTSTTSGSPPDGYVIGDVKPELNQVRVTGPESVIERVTSASVNVEVTGYTSNIATVGEVKLFDSDGAEIRKDSLQLSVPTVNVNVTILATKRVPVVCTVSGSPDMGYLATGEVVTDPDTVLLAGKPSVLDDVSQVTISNHPALDLTGHTDNLNENISILSYLPIGTSNGDPEFSGMVNVTAYVEKIQEKTVEIPYRHTRIENVPEGYKAEFLPENNENGYSLLISGLERNISDVNYSDIEASVDLQSVIDIASQEEIISGNYRSTVDFVLPDGVNAVNLVKVLVRLYADEE